MIPANFTTLVHFSVSSAISLSKSAAEPEPAALPRAAKLRPRHWIGQNKIELAVQSLDDVSRRTPGRTDPVPSTRLITRQEVGDWREIR